MGATSLYLFGSTARNAAKKGVTSTSTSISTRSPISLIELVGIKLYLEDELDTPVDVTTREGLHHPQIRRTICRARLLMTRDPTLRLQDLLDAIEEIDTLLGRKSFVRTRRTPQSFQFRTRTPSFAAATESLPSSVASGRSSRRASSR